MLDNISINRYPGRVAAIEIHTRMWADTLCYNAEAYQRWLTLPGDANPSRLYIDGHRDPSYYWTWEDSIVNRMNKPAPVTIRMNGSFNPGNGAGSITGTYRNDSTAAITGQVMFVIVEDSVYYMDSLGGQRKEWHNHTPRDYIPGPLGTIFNITPGDSVIYTQPFTIVPPVRYQYCSIVTFIQDTVLRPDSVTKNIYQGGMVKVRQLVGVDEDELNDTRCKVRDAQLKIQPNPATAKQGIRLTIEGGPQNREARLHIYDVSGRVVKSIPLGSMPSAQLLLALKPGVYFYRFDCGGSVATGKVVIL